MMVPTNGTTRNTRPDVFKKQLKDEPEFSGVQVTWVDEFMGMEADVLIWLGDSFCYNTMPCQFTRVSGKLIVVCLPQKGREAGSMVDIMREACLGKGTAKWAPEQENVGLPISIIQQQKPNNVHICWSTNKMQQTHSLSQDKFTMAEVRNEEEDKTKLFFYNFHL